METNQLAMLRSIILEKDKKIAELEDLIKNNVEEHRQSIIRKINYYENILAFMPGHVYWLDRHNVYMGCNDIQAKTLGLSSRHDIVGKRSHDLLQSYQYAYETDEVNSEIMTTGTAYVGIEHARLPDGEGIYFSQKVPLRDETNEVIGLLGISIDITELKQTEAALTIAKEHAEAANRAKIEFIANMSHDIRTPLTGVVGMAHLLEDRLTQPDHKQFAHWIHQSGVQLLSLLNSILDVVSAENVSDNDINNERFDLRQCIDEIAQLERPTTVLKQIELNVSVDDLAPQYIISDRAKIHRVLLNLLGNAIKFTQTGYILIEVNMVDIDGDTAYLQFQVVDTGIGISQEHQDKIFDRFFRVSSSYNGVYTGYGVGLHIAQSYVKLLGGELNFTSQPGMGTTFYFDLPVNVAKAEVEINTAKEINVELDILNREKPPHLLLVEDNAIALRMVELIADQAGCLYTSAVNGEDALVLAKSMHFDLIITDIGLPGMSGYQFTRSVREWESSQHVSAVPIVGLTAHAHAKNQCLNAGMNDVYCKPLNLDVMESILYQYINDAHTESIHNEPKNGLPDQDAQLFQLDQFSMLDIEHALQRIGNKTILMEMLHLMATQEIPNDERALQAAYAAGDWETIEKLAHKMKGGAVYCGTFKMQYACQYLERYRKSGQTKLLEQLYQQLLCVLKETKKAIII